MSALTVKLGDKLADMLARVGKTRGEFRAEVALAPKFHKLAVQDTPDLRRIAELPRYRWQDDPDLPALADALTEWLALPRRDDCRRQCGHDERQRGCAECERAASACVCRGEGRMSLRPVQAAILQAIHDWHGALGPIRVGGGKCLGVGTLVLMYDGSKKRVEDVLPGDLLLGPDSLPRKVLGTTRGRGPLFRIVPVKGAPWVCNDVHVLTLTHTITGAMYDLPLDQYLTMSAHARADLKQTQAPPVDFAPIDAPVPVDPYFLGLWYGDGTKALNGVSISKPDIEVERTCEAIAAAWGLRVRVSDRDRCPTYHLVQDGRDNPLLKAMREIVGEGLALPVGYLQASRGVRAALLAGFLDADGYMHHGHFEIVQKVEGFADGIEFLAQSLGLRVTRRIKRVAGAPYHRLFISGDFGAVPLRLPRKIPGKRAQKKDVRRTGFAVESLGPGEYAGFELDGDGRFLLGDFTITHNTLVSRLAPVVCDAEPSLLLVPAKLRGKTLRDFALLDRHWRRPSHQVVMSYELLSRDRGVRELEVLAPALIIADEGHKLKNTKAAVTRRVRRYLTGADSDRGGGAEDGTTKRCAFVDLSGTLTKRSLLDYHHCARWALGDVRIPLPTKYPEAATWALAIDSKVPHGKRAAPGALLKLCNPSELDALASGQLQVVRDAYRRRFMESPGVCGTEETDDGGVALVVRERRLPLPESIREHFDRLRDDWQTPDGQDFSEPVELRRHARELALGLFYKWDPAAPLDWMQARRAWHAKVREVLAHSRSLDTELQVARAAAAGELEDYGAGEVLAEWQRIRPTFEPNPVAVWVHDAALQDATAWLREEPHGIVWCEHVKFAQMLAKVSGFPYFGRGGLDERKRFIEDHEGACIASIEANKEGRNLQFAHARNYVSATPPGGDVWEQMIGRTHRDGQDADEVTVDVVLACWEQWADLEQSRRDSEYVGRTTGQVQKLQIADFETPTEVEVAGRYTDPLWRKAG